MEVPFRTSQMLHLKASALFLKVQTLQSQKPSSAAGFACLFGLVGLFLSPMVMDGLAPGAPQLRAPPLRGEARSAASRSGPRPPAPPARPPLLGSSSSRRRRRRCRRRCRSRRHFGFALRRGETIPVSVAGPAFSRFPLSRPTPLASPLSRFRRSAYPLAAS